MARRRRSRTRRRKNPGLFSLESIGIGIALAAIAIYIYEKNKGGSLSSAVQSGILDKLGIGTSADAKALNSSDIVGTSLATTGI